MMPVPVAASSTQERSEDLEHRRAAIDRINREHAQLKLRRDDLTNERK